jgi:rhomboid protease GluP
MTDLYYITDARGRRGPFTLADLVRQPFGPDALVLRNGREPGVPVWELPELQHAHAAAHAAEPPRVVPRAQRSVVWSGHVTNAVLAANVLVYVAMVATGVHPMNPDGDAMIRWGADYWPLTTSGQPWRLLTAAFLHFGLIHLLANMYALVSVGWLVERLLGRWFYAAMYLLSAVLSSVAAVWWDRGAVVAGESGAVFAVYGAMLGYLLVHRGAFPRQVMTMLMRSTLIFVGINVAFGLTNKGISNAAHIGGLACGLVLGAIFARPLEPVARARQTRGRGIAAAVISVASLAAVAVVLPRGGLDAASERRFVEERKQIFEDEQRAARAYKALLERTKGEDETGASDLAFAEGLERDVIPIWDSIVARLEGLTIAERSPSRRLYGAMLEYYGNWAQAYRALALAARAGDEASLDRFKKLQERGEAAAGRLRGAMEE